jgi:glutathione S-transferase
MLLIGMFDSPYVRRVAITMKLQGVAFEHASWSVGKDLAKIQQHNPLGQVPTLVLDDGEALIESAMILDYLDDLAGPARALLPASGAPRRQAQKLVALAMGVADKARMQAYEWIFRPAEKQHEPLRLRLRAQMLDAVTALEAACAARGPGLGQDTWLVGDRMTQADISLGCALTYASEVVSLPESEAPAPALRAFLARLQALPAFREIYLPFDAPKPTT